MLHSPQVTSARIPLPGLLWVTGLVLALGCGSKETQRMAPTSDLARQPLQVVATIPPLADLATRLGGDAVRVFSLMPPGTSPHTFSLAPREARRLETADLVLRVGHPALPFEDAVLRAVSGRSDVRHLALVDAESPAIASPHAWLSPTIMGELSGRLTEELVALDSVNKALYRSRSEVFLSDLEGLRATIRQRLETRTEGRTFLVYHPAWESFAEEFGLSEMAVEREGKEATARDLTLLIEQLRQSTPSILFVQPGLGDRGASALARELGLDLVPLDPLPTDWFHGLEVAADKIHQGLFRP